MMTNNKISEHKLTLSLGTLFPFRLRAGLLCNQGSILNTNRSPSLFHSMQAGHETHQAFYIDTSGALPRILSLSGREADHVHPVSRLRNHGAMPPSTKYCFTEWGLIKYNYKFTCALPQNDCTFASKSVRSWLMVKKVREGTRIRRGSMNLRSESEHRNC